MELDPLDVKDAARAKEIAEGSCLYLRKKKDDWLAKWGSKEGRKEWIRQDQEHPHRNKKASASAYYRAKKYATRMNFLFGFECSKGLPFKSTREIVGPFFQEHVTQAYCEMQETCSSYKSVDQALIDLARFPKGSA